MLFLPGNCYNVIKSYISEKVNVKVYFIENYNEYFGKT